MTYKTTYKKIANIANHNDGTIISRGIHNKIIGPTNDKQKILTNTSKCDFFAIKNIEFEKNKKYECDKCIFSEDKAQKLKGSN